MRVHFLLDEHLPLDLIAAVRRLDSAIDILRVGSPAALPLGTSDPDLLVYCEAERRVLVTDNRTTMPKHIADHLAAGRRHWGIFEISRKLSLGQMANQVHMFWAASEAEGWLDRMEYLPY